jgi:hypothetical protein
MTEQFIKDRARGRIAQDYVAGMLRHWGCQVENVPDGYFPGYDIIANGKTIEVKHDLRAEDTGRLCLELDALWHSKAQFLVIAVGNPIKTIYLHPLQEVLRFAEKWPLKKRVGEYQVEAALVPIKTFVEFLNPQIFSC